MHGVGRKNGRQLALMNSLSSRVEVVRGQAVDA